MGIPIYYKKIIDKHPECIYDICSDLNVDTFLIDFNAFIYNVIPLIDVSLSTKDFESSLISETVKGLINLVNIVKPTKLLYIAMDGPPPRAKMIQQRSRRYKSLKEAEFIKELEKKYSIKIPRSKWNKNAISPGTVFMSKLSKEIMNSSFRRIEEIIFSSDLVSGEGEHKLMPHLKEGINVIYSPDADMIVLSVLSNVSKILIFRTDSQEKNTYLDIDILRTKIRSSFDVKEGLDINRILKDYSFLTFLCGNDFVQAVSFLKIKDNGLDTLIKIYTDIFKSSDAPSMYLLTVDNKINNIFLLEILKVLTLVENDKLKLIQKKRHHTMKKDPKILKDNEIGKEPWQIELNRFQHEEYYSPLNPKYNPHHFNKINYYDQTWVQQYNNYFFPNIDKNEVCLEYYKSLQFCTEYYFNKNISWNYFYKYRTSPTMNDFCKFMQLNQNLTITWEPSSPSTPFEQLMMILPNSSHSLLPKCLRSLESDKEFQLDIMHGIKFIYSEAILPHIENENISKLIKTSNFSIQEIKRNTIKDKPFIFK